MCYLANLTCWSPCNNCSCLPLKANELIDGSPRFWREVPTTNVPESHFEQAIESESVFHSKAAGLQISAALYGLQAPCITCAEVTGEWRAPELHEWYLTAGVELGWQWTRSYGPTCTIWARDIATWGGELHIKWVTINDFHGFRKKKAFLKLSYQEVFSSSIVFMVSKTGRMWSEKACNQLN